MGGGGQKSLANIFGITLTHKKDTILYISISVIYKTHWTTMVGGWLCFTSHRQRGHLETAPPFNVPCERTWSSVNTLFPPGFETRAVTWQFIFLVGKIIGGGAIPRPAPPPPPVPTAMKRIKQCVLKRQLSSKSIYHLLTGKFVFLRRLSLECPHLSFVQSRVLSIVKMLL